MKQRHRITTLVLPFTLLMATSIADAAESKLTASIRIGATIVDNDDMDSDVAIRNFGSRIKWSGEQAFDNGLSGIGYVELGINPDNNSRGSSGLDRTRQAWAGLKGGFGTVKVGAQYAAFYDSVSGKQDIAWWGSCWTQFECSRETQVLKYSGSTGALSYVASIQGNAEDDGNDVADEFELGVNVNAGSLVLGLATSVRADEEELDGGTLFGAVASGSVGPLGLGLGFQRADADFAASSDAVTHTTLTATYGNAYTILNRTDNGDAGGNSGYGTLGYTLNIGDASLMYFEYQLIDDGSDAGNETIVRATYKYDFGVL